MKKLKLDLKDLKVESFETSKVASSRGTVKGQATYDCLTDSPTCAYTCPITCFHTCVNPCLPSYVITCDTCITEPCECETIEPNCPETGVC